ncbi:hypothetical protein [Massilia yuzhufengensis]|uniref:Uncharacterized protein n=1 Tax=Massilia yuzhufengensis TaxID=1164594 RepID=A0A1I1HLN6_9BURK|nr:hypothetical protein [Massilia yuzhufengensis]SFC22878.1 hypothetical protein SAMN05216204_104242 [Massilia yuzhufengensis]
MNRSIRTGSLLAAALLYSALTHAAPAAASIECGLGPPPNDPGFATANARKAAEVKQRGYNLVCAANLDRYTVRMKDKAAEMKGLAFPPVDLSRTPFARLTALGALAETVGDVPSRLYRGFRMPGGQVLTLFEHDMSADGTSAWRDPADEPERINKLPARLVVLQAPSGQAVSVLSWFENRRGYELWIDANVAGSPLRGELFALAASLPPSVKGCPNEPPPKVVRRGADGFPEDEPAPKFITQAQVDAMRSAKRPCK